MKTGQAFLMAAAMGMMAGNMMGSNRYSPYFDTCEKKKLSLHQKKRRKNAKLAKMSRKKNRRK